jgi:hypothetical protein
VADKGLEKQRDELAKFAIALGNDAPSDADSSLRAIDLFYIKARTLTSSAQDALLIAASAARHPDVLGQVSSKIAGPSPLRADALHHFFANAYNRVASSRGGRLITFGGSLFERHSRDRRANYLGSEFGAMVQREIAIAGRVTPIRFLPSAVIR